MDKQQSARIKSQGKRKKGKNARIHTPPGLEPATSRLENCLTNQPTKLQSMNEGVPKVTLTMTHGNVGTDTRYKSQETKFVCVRGRERECWDRRGGYSTSFTRTQSLSLSLSHISPHTLLQTTYRATRRPTMQRVKMIVNHPEHLILTIGTH
eukprot:scpid87095/ scgid19955/ 